MKSTVVVAIDINENHAEFRAHVMLSAREQIKLLQQRIHTACNVLKQKEPNALWIMTWREYGVTEGEVKILSPEMRKHFKETMGNLAKQYGEQLIIVAGTIATGKRVSDVNKLKKIKSYYEKHAWIKLREDAVEDALVKEMLASKTVPVKPRQASKTVRQDQISREIEKINVLESQPGPHDFTVIRNTAYIFHGNEIYRHDKIAPFEESRSLFEKNKSLNKNPEREIFQPAKGRNLDPYFRVIHPFTQEVFTLGLEICREHMMGVLKEFGKNNPQLNPKLQLVMSRTTGLNLENLLGKYVIPVDSFFKPRLITANDNIEQAEVALYQTNLLSPTAKLYGPLQPEYPIERQIFDKLNAFLLKYLPMKDSTRRLLQELLNLRRQFLDDVSHLEDKQRQCADLFITNHLDELQANLKALQALLPTNSSTPSLFQLPNDAKVLTNDIAFLIQDIMALIMIEKEKAQLGEGNYFQGRFDALPLDKLVLFNAFVHTRDKQRALQCLIKYNLFEKITYSLEQVGLLIGAVGDQNLSVKEQENIYSRIFNKIPRTLMEPHVSFENTRTLFCMLVTENMETAVKCALPYCKDKLNEQFEDGETALHIALRNKVKREIIQVLLEHGCDVSIRNKRNESAVQLAQLHHPSVADLILQYQPKHGMAP